MKLHLTHGRLNPEQDMEDWGFDGPVLENITKLTWTYGNVYVWFDSSEATDKARQMTQWQRGLDLNLSLEMPCFDDVVWSHTLLSQTPGFNSLPASAFNGEGDMTIPAYFGDWHLMS